MHTGKKLLAGEIKDISVNGALIRCEEVPSTEETIEISIELSDLFYVSATVENVRFNVDDSHGNGITYELAVRFKEMTEDGRRVLHNAIEQEARKKEH
jgi:hypothetical protein